MGLEELLKEKGALMFGEFTLTSGRKSSYYVNIKKAYTEPAVLARIAEELSPFVKGKRLAGVALGAIPILVAVSLKTGVPFSMIRKENREHGTAAKIEGDIGEGETVDIVEDVTTTGGSVMSAVKMIRSNGGKVERVIVVVDRGEGAADLLEKEGVALHALIGAGDLQRMLEEAAGERK